MCLRVEAGGGIAIGPFGVTNWVTPNCRSSHQIPSCGGPQGRNPHLFWIRDKGKRVLEPFEPCLIQPMPRSGAPVCVLPPKGSSGINPSNLGE